MTILTEIMYVEDDLDIQEIAQLSLEEVGHYKVTICSSGEEAIRKLETYRPQLILLDVMMPEMDGITTYKFIRGSETAKDIPVIFMTAKVQKFEIDAYLKLGAIGVISKPFEAMALPRTIQDLWKKNQNAKAA